MEGINVSELFGRKVVAPTPPENFGLQPLPEITSQAPPQPEQIIRTFHDTKQYRFGPVLRLSSEAIHASKRRFEKPDAHDAVHLDMLRSQLARAGAFPLKEGTGEETDYVDIPANEVAKAYENKPDILKAA